MKVESKTYPVQIYLAKGADGVNRFYNSDPLGNRNLQDSEIDLAEELYQFYGHGDPVNPVVFKICGFYRQRAEEFDISMPQRIWVGRLAKHFEDMEGSIVEILQTRSSDARYIFNGIVLNRQGEVTGRRLYDGSGYCNDGQENHRLYVFDGLLVDNGEADKVTD